MDEHEFDALFPYRSFGSKEATLQDARLRRCSTLASALFGKTSEDLRQQLLAPCPKIPPGFPLSAFRDLQKHTETLLATDPTSRRFMWRHKLAPGGEFSSRTIVVGTRRYSAWEARYEIVRRAIEFLENQK